MATFYVDILDTAGALIGPGPLANVLWVEITTALDRTGSVKFAVPATDPRALSLLSNEYRMRVRADGTELRTGIIRSKATAIGDTPTITVEGPDLGALVARYNCHRNRVYDTVAVSTVLADLLSGTGISVGTVDGGLGSISARFDGDTKLGAIQSIREKLGKHWRILGTAMDFGAFGTASGVRMSNVHHALVAQESNTALAIIDTLEVISDSWEVCNRIIPIGAGDGDAQLTLENVSGASRLANTRVQLTYGKGNSTLSAGASVGATSITVASATGFAAGDKIFIGNSAGLNYTHETNTISEVAGSVLSLQVPLVSGYSIGANVIAQPQYFIKDSSHTTNPREQTMAWKDISPVDNTDASIEAAANLLYDAAWAHLQSHLAAQVVYRANTSRLPAGSTVNPGDTVQLVYNGVVTRGGVVYSWLDVDTAFYVLSITQRLNGDGSESVSLELSNVNRQPEGDSSVVAGAVTASEVWKQTVQAVACRMNDTQTRMINYSPATTAQFAIELDDGVTFLNSAKISFSTYTLSYRLNVLNDSSGTAVKYDGGALHSPSGGTAYLSAYPYMEAAPVVPPEFLSLSIDGVDVTTRLGGPWSPGGTPITLDITEILRKAAGGMQSRHTLVFTAGGGSPGFVEMTTKLQMTVQAIAVT